MTTDKKVWKLVWSLKDEDDHLFIEYFDSLDDAKFYASNNPKGTLIKIQEVNYEG